MGRYPDPEEEQRRFEIAARKVQKLIALTFIVLFLFVMLLGLLVHVIYPSK